MLVDELTIRPARLSDKRFPHDIEPRIAIPNIHQSDSSKRIFGAVLLTVPVPNQIKYRGGGQTESLNVDPRIEDGVLFVSSRLDLGNYQGLQLRYTKYNVENYARSFRLSNAAQKLKDGVPIADVPRSGEDQVCTIRVS